jgi:hypothetical protein
MLVQLWQSDGVVFLDIFHQCFPGIRCNCSFILKEEGGSEGLSL